MARIFVTRHLPGPALDRLADTARDSRSGPTGCRPPTSSSTEHVRNARRPAVDDLRPDRRAADRRLPRNLKAIANYAVGYDNVDVDAATRRGIPVGNTPDVLTDATADLAFTLLLAAARRLPEATATVTDGSWDTWDPTGLLGRSVNGKTLGIIGAGRIGEAVAKRASGFEMEVLRRRTRRLMTQTGHAQQDGRTHILELLQRSDFISIHCPLTEQTRHLIDAEALG